MLIKDIRVFPCFRENPPKAGKMEQKEAYYRETGCFQSTIVLDEDNHLIDGYTSYLLAEKYHVASVPVRYGKRQVVKAYHKQGGRLYTWELPKELVSCVSAGDRVLVRTKRGRAVVTVSAVEEYRPQEYPEPLKMVIRKKAVQQGNI